MKEYRKLALENQITSMLNQVMDEENNNQNKEKLFFSENEEELEEETEPNNLKTNHHLI